MTTVITLAKDEAIDLTKGGMPGGVPLDLVEFGLGWTPESEKRPIDLDASILFVDDNNKGTEFVFYGNLQNSNGSVKHSGDDLTGKDDGEGEHAPDEIISVSLMNVPANVKSMFLIINSYNGQGFGQIVEAFCTVDDKTNSQALAFYDLDRDFANAKTIVVGKITRDADNWVFTAVGKKAPSLEGLLQSYGFSLR